jgi:outer membrane protein OmpA-like peptidoglycan-associated protein
MRERPLLIVLALCAAVPAGAQVSVDLHALDSLPAANPAPRPAARQQPPRPKVTLAPPGAPIATATPTVSSQPVQATPAPMAPEPTATAELPTAPPPVATGAAAPPLPAPPLPAPAAEAPKPATASLRIPFAADQTELGKDGVVAVQGMLQSAYATGAPAFTIVAYAAGSTDDPSSARRISLARALSTRGALMAEGVPSRRITVRALGSQAGGGPPDRVDIGTAPSATP